MPEFQGNRLRYYAVLECYVEAQHVEKSAGKIENGVNFRTTLLAHTKTTHKSLSLAQREYVC